MFGLSVFQHFSPIGLDIRDRSLRAIQLNGDRSAVVHAIEMEIEGPDDTSSDSTAKVAGTIRTVLREKGFRGWNAVLAVGHPDLLVQNIRVNDSPERSLTNSVLDEVISRTSLNPETVEIRCLDVGPVQQGETQRREVLLLTCRKAAVTERTEIANMAGIRLLALDAEPAALARAVLRQYRRQTDQSQTMLIVRIGQRNTLVLIIRGDHPLFAKYLPFGGHDLDQALVQQLQIPLESAMILRQGYGERRREQRDPEIVQTVQDCLQPLWDSWLEEIAKCARYYQVTFRGQPIERVVMSGSEVTSELQERLERFFDLPVEILDPFRAIHCQRQINMTPDWDIAVGLALYSYTSPVLA